MPNSNIAVLPYFVKISIRHCSFAATGVMIILVLNNMGISFYLGALDKKSQLQVPYEHSSTFFNITSPHEH